MRTLVAVVDWGAADASYELLGGKERPYADTLPPWRRAEWTRGRVTARAALALAGCPLYGVDILRGPDGAPRISDRHAGYVVSIAHTGHLAACAVTRTGAPVGVDVEYEQPELAELLPRITTEGETSAALDPTVTWAAKEAALKAAFARPGRLSAYVCSPGSVDGTLTVTGSPRSGLPNLTAWVARPAAAVLVTVTATAERPRVVTLTPGEAAQLVTAAVQVLAAGVRCARTLHRPARSTVVSRSQT